MAVIVNGSEIILSGMVGGAASGDSWWDPPGFASGDVVEALAEVGRDTNIVVRLNSGGGLATEGAAIHAAIAGHKGTVQIVVEGIAASAASLIAMAADTLTMAAGSVLMIHDPAGLTMGDVTAHEATIRALNALGDSYAAIYADKSGKTVEECRAIMRAETWLSVADAIAMGFADAPAGENDNDPGEPGEPVEPTAFAYGLYAHAPDRFVALANAEGWKPRAVMAAPAAPTGQKELSMSNTPAGGTPPAAPATPAAPSAPAAAGVDVAAVMAVLASAHYTAEQMTAFVAAGGDLAKAQARAAEVGSIKADIAKAKSVNPMVTMSVEDAVARGLSQHQAMAEMWPQITAQAAISPHLPADPRSGKSLMAEAAEKVNAENEKLRGAR
jgi:ATP-dependent Clp protease, protease subunit